MGKHFLVFLLLAFAAPAGAAEWPLYGLCMEMHDAARRTLPEQAALLKDLGFDGVGYPLWLDEQFDANLRTLDAAGLPVYLMYATVTVHPEGPAFDARLPERIGQLQGRPVTVSLLLQGLPPGDPRGMAPAVAALRTLAERAAQAGVRVSIYHHTGDWSESLFQALDVARRVDHPALGVNFNLCHWLKVEGGKDYRPVLRENAARIFAVTLNGAQRGATTWTDGLIQPLDRGDFDNPALLATLREIGYHGPVGLMCYGIPGDARDHLTRSIARWRAWQTP